jgi:hypothetical protein
MRLAVPTAIAAFLLAITGALTPASAVGADWQYVNGRSGECLRAATGGAPVVGSCTGSQAVWHWGTETNTWNGHAMRRLVNNISGDCLTSDYANGNDSVLMAPCGGGRSGQFWTADNDHMQNQNHLYLGSYLTGAGIHMTDWDWNDGPGTDPYYAWFGYVV